MIYETQKLLMYKGILDILLLICEANINITIRDNQGFICF